MAKSGIGVYGGIVTKRCKQCKQLYTCKRYRQDKSEYCSHDCASRSKSRTLKIIKSKQNTKTGKVISCLRCGREFYIPKNRIGIAKYCSSACGNASRAYPKATVLCKVCGKAFIYIVKKQHTGKKYCSAACRNSRGKGSQGGRVEVSCSYCHKKYTSMRWYVERKKRTGTKHFCSHDCNIKYWRVRDKEGPNKAEKELHTLIRPLGFNYVGDGKLFLGAKNPDFVNKKQKLIIELFGEHWHDKSEVALRKRAFKQYGYTTLIIWWKELGNLVALDKKLKKFVAKYR